MAHAGGSGADDAQKRWELENEIGTLAARDAAELDGLFKYDEAEQKAIDAAKPWRSDPHYFKKVRVSALALIKMAMHTRSGGNLEVMGMLTGKTMGDTFVVLDTFALPVEGTETRVNAAGEANEYMVDFITANKEVGRLENVVGWYHSHPGYGCWLSGIDCSTQMLNQQFQEPFLAIVIDPVRTVAAGKVEIGAFRTYPENYKPPEARGSSEYQTIPLDRIEDFGVHANQYYPLDVSFFKSAGDSQLLDLLWSKYWVSTLSSSTLVSNRAFIAGQIADLAGKLEQAEGSVGAGGRGGEGFAMGVGPGKAPGGGKGQSQLAKVARDSAKAAAEQINGLITQTIKDIAFNRPIVGDQALAALTSAAAATATAAGGAVPMQE
uniref:MPN domain-containing protein n=1 Tax=Prasinoderma coloniale TaxID=156133 RepID=A0A6U0QD08_9VIRI|eukprot:PRCOL_00006125-RA